MKQAGIVLVITAGVFFGVTWLLPSDSSIPADLQRPSGDPLHSEPESGASRRIPGPIDLRSIVGDFMFTPHERTVTIDDEEIKYIAAYTWCRRFEPGENDTYVMTDVRIVLNPTPRTPEDLAGLVRIESNASPAELGDILTRKMERASGLVASRAVFHGGRDVLTAEKVDLSGGVDAFLADTRDGKPWGRLHTQELTLEFEEGTVKRAWGPGEVRFEGNVGVIVGEEVAIDRDKGTLRLARNIRMTGLRLPGGRAPLNLTAAGPLIWFVGDAAAARQPFSSPGRLSISGDIRVTQPVNGLELRGDRLLLEVTGKPARLRHLQLDGQATVIHPVGRLDGALITYTVKSEKLAQIEISGSPVKITMTRGARILPGNQKDGPLVVTTSGTVRMDLDHSQRRQGSLEVVVGPKVSLSTASARVDAGAMIIRLIPGASPNEGAERSAAFGRTDVSGYVLSRIRLTEKVKGNGVEGTFACGTFDYERKLDDQGTPYEDVIRLEQAPRILMNIAGRPAQAGSSRLDHILAGPGRFEVRASDLIELRRDPLHIRPMTVTASRNVRASRFGPNPRGETLATISADRLDLLAVPGWKAHLNPANGPVGFRQGWEVRRAEATGAVHFRYGLRGRGTGSRFVYESERGELYLGETNPGKRARLELTDKRGERQVFFAPRFVYQFAVRRLKASGGAEAHLRMHPFALMRTPGSSALVDTSVFAVRMEITLPAQDASSGSSIRVEHLVADSGVRVQQPRAQIYCAFLETDLVRRQLVARGAPVRVEILDSSGDPEELFQAATIIGAWSDPATRKKGEVVDVEFLLRGNVRARFLAETTGHAMALGVKKTGASEAGNAAAPKLTPFEIVTDAEAFVSTKLIMMNGYSVVTQGDPEADGFRLAALRMALFLVPSGGERKGGHLRVFRGVAEENVAFVSTKLIARGEKMVFDAPQNLITLEAGATPLSLEYDGQKFPPMPAYLLEMKTGLVKNFVPRKRARELQSEGAGR